ncbi:MAG: hypothetical protein IKX88_02730, partial [Thermoguttaceae bacterium]|nr:hypothetical protein [Thermoguttaceae bacterium]
MTEAQNQKENGARFVAPNIGGSEKDNDAEKAESSVRDQSEESDETTQTEIDLIEQPQDASQGTPDSNVAGNQVDREPYDVYKENGHYFVDWEKPDVALVFTGMTNGYIEPCGCAGMDR